MVRARLKQSCATAALLAMSATFSTLPAAAGAFIVELDYSPMEVRPGGTLQVSGTCLDGSVPTEKALVYVFLLAGQPGAPFGDIVEFPVNAEGHFAGEVLLPVNSPPGDWIASLTCQSGDAALGAGDEGPFTVAGEPILPPPAPSEPPPPASDPPPYSAGGAPVAASPSSTG